MISVDHGPLSAALVAEMKRSASHGLPPRQRSAEAIEAQAAGADAVIAQGMEAGGHRGAFEAGAAEATMIGFDGADPGHCRRHRGAGHRRRRHCRWPWRGCRVDARASAVMVGTALLRSPEAAISPAWAEGLAKARPEDTVATRAFSGRLGRGLRTAFTEAMGQGRRASARSLSYPAQPHRSVARCPGGCRKTTIDRIQAWPGQSAGRAQHIRAGEIVRGLWADAEKLLPAAG